jgi:predicted flap endonuclease-1-like 5' DNA nuclease
MPSPVITVIVSLVLVAAIGYTIGLLRGRRLTVGARAEQARRRLVEADLDEARQAQERQRERLNQLEAEQSARGAEHGARDTERDARETELGARETELSARETELSARETELSARETELGGRQAELGARDAELSTRDTALTAREAELGARVAELTAWEKEHNAREAGRGTEVAHQPEAAATEMQELHDQLAAAVEECERLTCEGRLRDDQLRHARIELNAAVEELGAVRESAAAPVSARYEQLEDEVRRRDRRLERLQADLRELERGYATQIEERDAELNNQRALAEERAQTLDDARMSLQQAQSANETHRSELVSTRAAMGEIHATRSHLESELHSVREAALAAQEALVAARQETAELEKRYSAQIEQRAAHVDELQAARQHAEARSADLERQLQQSSSRLDEALAARGEVERRAADREREADALHADLRESLALSESERLATNTMLADLQIVAQETQAELETTAVQLDEQSTARAQSEADLHRLRDDHAHLAEDTERRMKERSLEVDHLSRTVASRGAELERAQAALAAATTRVEAVQAELATQKAETAEVSETLASRERDLRDSRDEQARQAAALEAARTDMAEAETRAERRLRERTLEAERVVKLLHEREAELTRAAQVAAALEDRISQEEERCRTRDQRIAVLEADQLAAADATDRVRRELHEREQETRRLRTLVPVTSGAQDDLQELDGIGPSIASLLNSVGVRSFREIAAWDPRTIEWLTVREPQLKGRLRKEWIAAARKAHTAKYGTVPIVGVDPSPGG